MAWDWDIGQWFTPPKDKDIWTAMTKGSTGGWAKDFAKPATLLPTVMSIIGTAFGGPVGGAILGGGTKAIQGGTTDLWGDADWENAIKQGLSGANQGYSGGMPDVDWGKILKGLTQDEEEIARKKRLRNALYYRQPINTQSSNNLDISKIL